VAIGGENHRAVAMTMPTVLASSVHQLLTLALGDGACRIEPTRPGASRARLRSA
jgi:hypothetical protein